MKNWCQAVSGSETAFFVHGTAVEQVPVSPIEFMKAILTFLLLGAGFGALAQSSSTLSTTINDDEKTLSIQIEGDRNGRTINYDRKFDVRKLNAAEKDALKNRVLDSLGVGESALGSETATNRDRPVRGTVGGPTPPNPAGNGPISGPKSPAQPNASANTGQTMVTFRCESCAGKVKLEVASPTEDYAIERDAKVNTDKRLFPYQLALSPGEYKLTYYQNGVLQIQSTFTAKAGEANTVVIK
ncbi:hypothetical protein [Spirosoma oryzicola]|uniref:hypothetical protein n=1 Tax=Spirosoma oryzicola TaxID=2898794 RepID=UPI001E2AA39F|nr:hypothetical protein [Spirosoma oryzicola]UHG92169.1 hypothetical protein LQ777_04500 [Spirosoma oryzicola]